MELNNTYAFGWSGNFDVVNIQLNKTLPLLNIKYIPMTEKFVEKSKEIKDIETYYHSCDDQWNSKGNILAEDVIKNFLFQ